MVWIEFNHLAEFRVLNQVDVEGLFNHVTIDGGEGNDGSSHWLHSDCGIPSPRIKNRSLFGDLLTGP